MAVTKGQGNPNWNRDETLLALDLYNKLGGKIPSKKSEQILSLSNLLRTLPYHADVAKNDTFRNPAGVAFKLQNLGSVLSGKGFDHASNIDKAIVKEFGHKPDDVTRLAYRIKQGIEALTISSEKQDDSGGLEEEYYEGQTVYRLHRVRERNRNVRKMLLKKRKGVKLCCEICDFARTDLPLELQESFFEVHHITPLSEAEGRKTKLSEMALLCACCHRALHKLISINRRWIGIEEAREELSNTNLQ